MSKERLKALEEEVNAELKKMAELEGSKHRPITDGVVDIDRYLSSSPKILWILKEPWEKLEEKDCGGSWSVTQDLIPDLIAKRETGGICTYRRMAYITYSIFNKYTSYSNIPYATDDPSVGDSLKNIAYININKFPGNTTSVAANIEFYYRRNRNILMRQIKTINPDVVIGGNILHLFFDDLGIKSAELKSEGSVDFCSKNGRLYINAYHPGYWRISEKKYVEDIVAVIKMNWQGS
jgi:hypothetical protein